MTASALPFRVLMQSASQSLASKIWRALVLAGAGLFAIELGPVIGLLSLMAFEFGTAAAVARSAAKEAIPDPVDADREERRDALSKRRALARRQILDSAKERVGVVIGLIAVVVYANTAGLEWLKGMMFMTVGAVLLTLAWINLGRSNKLIRLLLRSLLKNLKSRGIDIDTDDEEGPTVLVDAQVHAVVQTHDHVQTPVLPPVAAPRDGRSDESVPDPHRVPSAAGAPTDPAAFVDPEPPFRPPPPNDAP